MGTPLGGATAPGGTGAGVPVGVGAGGFEAEEVCPEQLCWQMLSQVLWVFRDLGAITRSELSWSGSHLARHALICCLQVLDGAMGTHASTGRTLQKIMKTIKDLTI